MKRTLAYMVTGIMLGIAIMFIPLIVFIPSNVSLGAGTLVDPLTVVDSARKLGTEEYKGAAGAPSQTEQTLGAVSGITLPLSLLYVSLIFAVSLLSALGVYSFFKRRLIS